MELHQRFSYKGSVYDGVLKNKRTLHMRLTKSERRVEYSLFGYSPS